MILPAPFSNTRSYRAAFSRGLGQILQHDQLGTYILALANATYDAEIHHILKSRLQLRYAELSTKLKTHIAEGMPLDHASDDVLVFLKLMAVGFSALQMSAFRNEGVWRVQYNQLRSFRPARMSNIRVDDLQASFNTSDFHFNKPFLDKEIFWQGVLLGQQCKLLYNKFPFADLHALLVVDPASNNSQFLDKKVHDYLWQLTATLATGMPDVGFGYNSRGAYSSVNHQHFQMFVHETEPYPIENECWQHNGGLEIYPLACSTYTSAAESWQMINELHASNTAYNLLYRPEKIIITARKMQGHYQHNNWTSGFAWAEVAGSITTFNASDFTQLTEQNITQEMDLLQL